MKRVPLLILICIGIITFQGSAAAITVDLISNGNFSGGLASWTAFGSWWATVDTIGGTLNWDNTQQSTTTGDATGAYQTLNANVLAYNSLIFKCDVEPISQSRESPGTFPYDIEYPVHIEIDYVSIGNTPGYFQHGFYYLGDGNGTVQGTFVAQNTWLYSYTSPNLLTLPGGVQIINQVQVYGNGLNYKGSADNVQLLASTDVIPEPATLSLLGLGLFGLAGFRKRRV